MKSNREKVMEETNQALSIKERSKTFFLIFTNSSRFPHLPAADHSRTSSTDEQIVRTIRQYVLFYVRTLNVRTFQLANSLYPEVLKLCQRNSFGGPINGPGKVYINIANKYTITLGRERAEKNETTFTQFLLNICNN